MSKNFKTGQERSELRYDKKGRAFYDIKVYTPHGAFEDNQGNVYDVRQEYVR